MAATTEEVPRSYGRGTSSVVSFVVAIVAMNRVDVVDLVVDLVDVDLDIDLVDVDLDVDLVDVGLVDVVPAVFSFFGPRLYFWLLGPGCIFGCWPWGSRIVHFHYSHKIQNDKSVSEVGLRF